MPPSSNSLSPGSAAEQNGSAPPAAVASASFHTEATADMGVARGSISFFPDSLLGCEFVRRSVLANILPGGYGKAAAAADLGASASFIYRPMGIKLRPLLLVPWLQPALPTQGEAVTRRSSISNWDGEFGEPSLLPDLPPP